MFKSDNFYNLKISLFFGITGAILANFRFSIPGVEGGVSDAREIAALISILFITKWPYTFLVGLLVSLGGPYNALPTTIIMHLVAIPFAWSVFQKFNYKSSSLIKISIKWMLLTLFLYISIYSTVFILAQSIFQQLPAKNFISTYIIFINAVSFEAIITTLITTLAMGIIKSQRELRHINRQLKDEIKLNQDMKTDIVKAAKLQSISSLASGIAHDFNNLLTGILGSINMISLESSKNDKINNYAELAKKACFRASKLTEELMLFARGKTPNKEISSLLPIIKDTSDFLIQDTNINLSLELSPDLYKVNCDTIQITQVIQNLLINAKQAMDNFGKISIRAVNIEYSKNNSTVKSGKYVKITITDSGKGIEAENIEQIFDPYYSTKENGTGLGLAIINSIIKNHDGYIFVNSIYGEGATFSFLLPGLSK